MPMRDCPVGDCRAQIPNAMLMCKTHWKQVSRDLQRAVTRAWRERQAARSSGKALRAHMQACEDAIAHVEGREPEEIP
jgi:hypothetical protein